MIHYHHFAGIVGSNNIAITYGDGTDKTKVAGFYGPVYNTCSRLDRLCENVNGSEIEVDGDVIYQDEDDVPFGGMRLGKHIAAEHQDGYV
jgi:hypothetical protein